MLDNTFSSNTNDRAPGKLIFVVEDDEDIGFLLVQVIHQETVHKAIHYINARDTLTAVTRQSPHLFILDYSLPDINGLELHDWLQSFPHIKSAQTILMSARNPPLDEINKRGIIFLRKPFAVTKLLETIKNLF